MKKLFTLLTLLMFAFANLAPVYASNKSLNQQHLTKSGKADKRYNENKHVKKDGSPDMRYKSSKKAAAKKKM